MEREEADSFAEMKERVAQQMRLLEERERELATRERQFREEEAEVAKRKVQQQREDEEARCVVILRSFASAGSTAVGCLLCCPW